MYAQVIQQMDPRKIDEDTVNGLRVMLEHETFKEFHPLINKKLEEVKKVKEEPEKLIGSFSLEIGKFYKTMNGSIVKCINSVAEQKILKKNEKPKVIAYHMFVLQGGYDDPDLNNIIAHSQYGTTNENGAYIVDTVGKFVAYCEKGEDHPMHILSEIKVKLTVD